jgi:Na+(H+)/acetate symporter ActP
MRFAKFRTAGNEMPPEMTGQGTFLSVLRSDRIILLNAIALGSAMVAAVVGGLAASSWIWAIACAVFVYAGFRVGAMIWISRKLRQAALIQAHFPRREFDSDDIDFDFDSDSGSYGSHGSRVYYFDSDDIGPDLGFDRSDWPDHGSSWPGHQIQDRPPRGLPGPSGQD